MVAGPAAYLIKITDKTRSKLRRKQWGNTATPSSDSEREAKTREVVLPYPTLINYKGNKNSTKGRVDCTDMLVANNHELVQM